MHTLSGNFRYHHNFHSQYLPDDRDVIVYLPPDYDSAPGRHYPVLYLHDGQNVFDSETAFGGQEWRADETAQMLIHEGAIRPIIMVGIYNTGASRIHEYTPTCGPYGTSDGKAGLYSCMILEELMPFIQRQYRVLTGPANTGMGGSSLGGLVTLYIGLSHPEIFGRLAVLSPSIWWDHGVILQLLQDLAPRLTRYPKAHVWLDMGTEEGARPRRMVRDARMLRDLLMKRGWTLDQNLTYFEDEGAGHNEGAWARRLPMILRFLFGTPQ